VIHGPKIMNTMIAVGGAPIDGQGPTTKGFPRENASDYD